MPEDEAKHHSLKNTGELAESMQEMIEVLERSIDQEMERDASPGHLARAAVIALCDVMGGGIIYLPRGTALKKKLRDNAIYGDHLRGLSHKDLIRKYKIASAQMYGIISAGHRQR